MRYALDWRTFPLRTEVWAFIGNQLCRLVDRLHAMGYRRTLEVELWFARIADDPGEYDFTNFLSGLKEKGVVTILDGAHDNRVFYSSARGR